jgi:predicted AAA+ superfamily ATPase
LLHTLLGVHTTNELEVHPKSGASWEGFVIEQAIQSLGAQPTECYFWRTHTGAELDLLLIRGQRRVGIEVKRSTEPAITPSMRIALDDLKLGELYVVHAGEMTFPLSNDIRAVALRDLVKEIEPLR